jgi:MoaA/NifB/PqqE/SkfB family radical SAM enzyme
MKITQINKRQFTKSGIDQLLVEIERCCGTPLSQTVSLCHLCYYHIPAMRYSKDGKVYLVKNCATHGMTHHMIESDLEFYQSLYYTQDNPKYNFNGGILIEVTDRCNLECPHCYHLPDNQTSDISINTLINRITEIIQINPSLTRIILSGAEATLRPDFAKLVTAIQGITPGIDVSVMTNGIRFGNIDFVEEVNLSGLASINIGLNHPTYINHKVIRRKQVAAIENIHAVGLPISYISYTMISLDEVDDIMSEICNNVWHPKNFRIRYGADIGRNPGQARVFVSDVYKAIESWCRINHKSFERIVDADNNIYHVMAKVEGKDIRIIQWCDVTDIDMEELRSGPWCDFVPDGVTNFLHQIIRRDIWKNQNNILPDTPPTRYTAKYALSAGPLDLYKLC